VLNGGEIQLRVQRNRVVPACKSLLDELDVTDIDIEDVPIEEIIRRLFSSKK
jgi:ABC-type uncharacterized transport system ATPase subunit